jgi:hypothetical protein
MTNIFTLENFTDFSEKINIDDLYERKRTYDINKLKLFQKILNRIHVKIKTCSRQTINEKFCWFLVPETIIGVPRYDQAGCIAYLIDNLQENGFRVKYIHPNLLLISWHHWVPSYVRNEIKKKTGLELNEYGEVIKNNNEEETDEETKNDVITNNNTRINSGNNNRNNKKYTPINNYKPSGKLVYNEDLLNRIEEKINF